MVCIGDLVEKRLQEGAWEKGLTEGPAKDSDSVTRGVWERSWERTVGPRLHVRPHFRIYSLGLEFLNWVGIARQNLAAGKVLAGEIVPQSPKCHAGRACGVCPVILERVWWLAGNFSKIW